MISVSALSSIRCSAEKFPVAGCLELTQRLNEWKIADPALGIEAMSNHNGETQLAGVVAGLLAEAGLANSGLAGD
jgi:hypothetical protein